jgi:hypothetical protein
MKPNAFEKFAVPATPPGSPTGRVNGSAGILTRLAEENAAGSILAATGFDLSDLLGMDMPEPEYIAPPFIAEGLTIFAGRPKIGKTTLIRQLLIAANNGSEFFGRTASKVGCLFLSLEEGVVLARKKFAIHAGKTKGIRIEFAWRHGIDGADQLREYLTAHPELKLIVVDSLSRFRNPPDNRTSAFQQDYQAITDLQSVCKEFSGLAIVVIHHTTKALFDDPIASISGTYGLTAACDSYGILIKKDDRFRLHWGGRLWDQEESDFELIRAGGVWKMLGAFDLESVALPKTQGDILHRLRTMGAHTGVSLASHFGITKQSASEHIRKLEALGLVKKSTTGHGYEAA